MPYPIQVEIPAQPQYNRFFAVPLIGGLARWLLLIPHLFIIYVLGLIVGILQLVLWIPVLFTGRFPDWGRLLVGGYVRWSTRMYAFAFGLTDVYPPFELGN
ncbi:MAG TPA: DUF4389 domain-containing protein [Candidatus Dormibacteraeota bacterium]|jgi:hypothetical protein|nr:DUF4389 domain-containing protein [Candidatus Dormibacteraeota bacterium]